MIDSSTHRSGKADVPPLCRTALFEARTLAASVDRDEDLTKLPPSTVFPKPVAARTRVGQRAAALLTVMVVAVACSSSAPKIKYVDIRVTLKIKGGIPASEGGCRQDDSQLSLMMHDPSVGGEPNILRAGRAVGIEYGDGGPSDDSDTDADYPDEDSDTTKDVSGGRLQTGHVQGSLCVFTYSVKHVPLGSACYAPTINGSDGTQYACYTSDDLANSPEMEYTPQ